MSIERIVVVFVVGLILSIAMRRSRKGIGKNARGCYVLKTNSLYTILGWIFSILSLIGLVLILFYFKVDMFDVEDGMYAYLLVGGFFLLGSFIVIASNKKVEFSNKRIVFHSMFGTRKSILWEKVDGVEYRKHLQSLIIYSRDRKWDIDIKYNGFATFLEMLENKLPYDDVYEVIREIRMTINEY